MNSSVYKQSDCPVWCARMVEPSPCTQRWINNPHFVTSLIPESSLPSSIRAWLWNSKVSGALGLFHCKAVRLNSLGVLTQNISSIVEMPECFVGREEVSFCVRSDKNEGEWWAMSETGEGSCGDDGASCHGNLTSAGILKFGNFEFFVMLGNYFERSTVLLIEILEKVFKIEWQN